MVDTEFLSVYDSTCYAGLPRLKADDVTAAVLYALSTSKHTQVNIWFSCSCYFNFGFFQVNT